MNTSVYDDGDNLGIKICHLEGNALNREEAEVFAHWLSLLKEQKILYGVGGAFAIHAYTGILRNTKDLDIYIKPSDLQQALAVFASAGYRTEVTDTTWLAKVHYKDYFMDLLFAMPRQRFLINNDWFEGRITACILDEDIDLMAIEKLFVSKVFMAKSYRFDGADILHLVLKAKGMLDWEQILSYMGDEWELLLWYLLLFNFVYPGHSDYLPQNLMVDMFEKVRRQWRQKPQAKVFRGTLLDRDAFEIDCRFWGYEDQGRDVPLVGENGEEQ